jgi:hypothetical protein
LESLVFNVGHAALNIYIAYSLVLILGAAMAIGSFIVLSYGERALQWDKPDWMWDQIIGWLGVALAIYAFLRLRLALLTSYEKRKR